MKKTDIGVVGFMYGVCVLFLVMTLRLKKAAQTYPLFIITLLALLTTLYVYNMVKDAKRLGVTSGLEEVFGETLPGQFAPVMAMIVGYLLGDVLHRILSFHPDLYGSLPLVPQGAEMADGRVNPCRCLPGLCGVCHVPGRQAAGWPAV